MARSIWTGSVSFGLVSVPVGLYSATEDHTVHFHQFERGTADRVRNQRVNERTGEEIDYEDIVKGRKVRGDKLVMVEPDELADIAPGRSRSIEITGFVDLADVDPIYFQRTYYLAPRSDENERAYALLVRALKDTNRAGIAMFVMRGKEYLAAVRAQKNILVLQTMFFADEVRDPRDELDSLPGQTRLKPAEVKMAVSLIESMDIPWKPREYRDTYRARVDKLIKAKQKGDEIVPEGEPPEETNVTDLMQALQDSVAGARKGSAGKSGARKRGGQKSTAGKAGARKGGARNTGSQRKPAAKKSAAKSTTRKSAGSTAKSAAKSAGRRSKAS